MASILMAVKAYGERAVMSINVAPIGLARDLQEAQGAGKPIPNGLI